MLICCILAVNFLNFLKLNFLKLHFSKDYFKSVNTVLPSVVRSVVGRAYVGINIVYVIRKNYILKYSIQNISL